MILWAPTEPKEDGYLVRAQDANCICRTACQAKKLSPEPCFCWMPPASVSARDTVTVSVCLSKFLVPHLLIQPPQSVKKTTSTHLGALFSAPFVTLQSMPCGPSRIVFDSPLLVLGVQAQNNGAAQRGSFGYQWEKTSHQARPLNTGVSLFVF